MKTEQKIYYTLRLASAMCFIGHGTFGIITKAIWCNYFAVFGIGHDMAYQLMPVLGTVDILMGISLLIYPVKTVALWLVIWGMLTAALRPLSGEPFAEMVERAGNFGAPLLLLLLCAPSKGFKGWFTPLNPAGNIYAARSAQIQFGLRITVFLLLAGHGWLNLLGKKALLAQYSTIGFHDVQLIAMIAGFMELTGALLILLRPSRSIVLIFFIWKMGTELFYPHWELFEWIERGGSYGTLLSLWFLLKPDVEVSSNNDIPAIHSPALS